MKKTFPLGQMTIQETEALDINKEHYINIFELEKNYKSSFVHIEIKQYNDDFFYGLRYVFKVTGLYHYHSFEALRKWGVFTSLVECKKAAIKEFKKAWKNEREKQIIKNIDLSLWRQGELF